MMGKFNELFAKSTHTNTHSTGKKTEYSARKRKKQKGRKTENSSEEIETLEF